MAVENMNKFNFAIKLDKLLLKNLTKDIFNLIISKKETILEVTAVFKLTIEYRLQG